MEGMKPKKPVTRLESVNTRNFMRIASGSTALGFGCVGAAAVSLRADLAGFSFQVTIWTFAAFFAGAALGVFVWRPAARGRTVARMGFLILTVGIVAFLSPLRFAPRDKRVDILIGLTVAVIVISTGGYLIWRIARFLDRDAAQAKKRPPGGRAGS